MFHLEHVLKYLLKIWIRSSWNVQQFFFTGFIKGLGCNVGVFNFGAKTYLFSMLQNVFLVAFFVAFYSNNTIFSGRYLFHLQHANTMSRSKKYDIPTYIVCNHFMCK
ncbi:hypothetical protein O6H91_Y106100 [Diphasiastrum complanatum]|nr:hypothetical protein O6H91_Y106100 [Diphasiastrum complanatum]